MIDDKKIEEAAKQHSEESYISGYFQACYKDAFIEGAKWMQEEFWKDLWRPASEMADKNRTCLVRVVYHHNRVMLQDEERIEQSSFHDFGWYDYDFKYIGTNYDIVSWLYISDLLPKDEYEFTIKGIKIMAASKEDAIKKYNHCKK